MSSYMLLQKYLDPVIEMFTTGEYYQEVFAAKEEFFERAGVIFPDDPEYEQRMILFMDWYLFDRDIKGVDLSPTKLYFRKFKDELSQDSLAIYRDFCSTVHSIFRMKGNAFLQDGLKIEDLFSKQTYVVQPPEIAHGFNRGDIFEGRIIPFRGKFDFSPGFCFHPAEMESFILSEIKKVRTQDKTRQTKLMLQLSKMKLKHQRFPHLPVTEVYRFDSRL